MYDMDNQVRSKFSCSTYLWSNMIQHQKKRPLHKREPQILLGQSGAGAATRYRVAPQHYRFQVLRIRSKVSRIRPKVLWIRTKVLRVCLTCCPYALIAH